MLKYLPILHIIKVAVFNQLVLSLRTFIKIVIVINQEVYNIKPCHLEVTLTFSKLAYETNWHTLENSSDAFIRVLCTIWQGQPIKYMAEFCASARDRMEFLTPMFTEVLSTEVPTQLLQGIPFACRT